mgnify:CR=1 FL=1
MRPMPRASPTSGLQAIYPPGSTGIVSMDVVEINKPGGDTDETARPASTGGPPIALNIDLTGREIGDSIHINDIALPNGVRPTIDRNFVVANIAVPSGLRASDDAAATNTMATVKSTVITTDVIARRNSLGSDGDGLPVDSPSFRPSRSLGKLSCGPVILGHHQSVRVKVPFVPDMGGGSSTVHPPITAEGSADTFRTFFHCPRNRRRARWMVRVTEQTVVRSWRTDERDSRRR